MTCIGIYSLLPPRIRQFSAMFMCDGAGPVQKAGPLTGEAYRATCHLCVSPWSVSMPHQLPSLWRPSHAPPCCDGAVPGPASLTQPCMLQLCHHVHGAGRQSRSGRCRGSSCGRGRAAARRYGAHQATAAPPREPGMRQSSDASVCGRFTLTHPNPGCFASCSFCQQRCACCVCRVLSGCGCSGRPHMSSH